MLLPLLIASLGVAGAGAGAAPTTPLERAARLLLRAAHEAEGQARAIGSVADFGNASWGAAGAFIEQGASWPRKGMPRKDPCEAGESDAGPSPWEIQTQGKDIAGGDKLRKYTTPCKPPPFMLQEQLQAPGLPTVPIAPPIEMPPPYIPGGGDGDSGGQQMRSTEAMAYAAAAKALRGRWT